MADNLAKKEYFTKSSYTDDWTRWVREHPEFSNFDLRMVKAVNAQDGEYILEVGAGEGNIAKLLLKNRIHYVGLDISYKILTYAKENFSNLNYSNFHLITADAEFIPLRRSMDTIFYYNTLFLVPSRYKTLIDAKQVLKANGKLVLDTNNFLNMFYIFHYINGRIRFIGKKIANKFKLVRKLIKIIRGRDYNPYFRPSSKGNVLIILWELKYLKFEIVNFSGFLTKLQEYFLKLIPLARVKSLLRNRVLWLFSGRIIIEARG